MQSRKDIPLNHPIPISGLHPLGAVRAGMPNLSREGVLAELFKHAFSNMWPEGVRGGNMKHGLLSGVAGALGGYGIEKYASGMNRVVKVTANAIVGGTVAELGGGKFANGAITSAFTMLYNDLMHQEPPEGRTEDVETLDPFQRIRELQAIQSRNAQSEPGLNNVYPEFELIFIGKGLINLLSGSIAKTGIKAIEAGNYTFTKTAAKHLSSRPYMNSPSTISNIMKSGKGVPDATFKGGINYKVPGTFNNTKGIWELGINPQTNTIYHFLFKSIK